MFKTCPWYQILVVIVDPRVLPVVPFQSEDVAVPYDKQPELLVLQRLLLALQLISVVGQT